MSKMSCGIWKLTRSFSKRYKRPIKSTSTSPSLPETVDEINDELRKQEILLSQIHAEMNTGFVSKKREEQLWEVQRIITQLKRKLRSFERKMDSMQQSIDDENSDVDTSLSFDATQSLTKSVCSDDESQQTLTIVSSESNTKASSPGTPDKYLSSDTSLRSDNKSNANDDTSQSSDEFTVNENGLLMLPESHPDYLNLLRLQLENQELMQWKQRLQRRIMNERAEVSKLKAILSAKQTNAIPSTNQDILDCLPDENNYERVVAQYVLENTLLEQKKNYLAKEIFEENQKLIQLQVELAIRQFQI